MLDFRLIRFQPAKPTLFAGVRTTERRVFFLFFFQVFLLAELQVTHTVLCGQYVLDKFPGKSKFPISCLNRPDDTAVKLLGV